MQSFKLDTDNYLPAILPMIQWILDQNIILIKHMYFQFQRIPYNQFYKKKIFGININDDS